MSSNTLSSPQIEKKADTPPHAYPGPSRAESFASGSDADEFEVVLEPADDPKQLSYARKWAITAVICSAGLCSASDSSVAAFTEAGIMKDLHCSKEVAILGISLYVLGLAYGPLLVAPLSEVYGRNPVYRVSYILFFAFSWPVAFAPNIACFLVFRFLTGFCSAAFLSVAGGTVSDLFANDEVATPMAVYTLFPFIGPILGPLVSGFVNQNLDWRWMYRIMIIWIFVEFLFLLLLPETFTPVLLKHKAQRIREKTGDSRYYAPIESHNHDIFGAILLSCYTPFSLVIHDRMALLLNLWNALILGILYLAFQAFPIIFEDNHGFNMQLTGLSFLGIGLGMIIALCTQPFWTRHFRNIAVKSGRALPPESLLLTGEVGGILVPIGLYWLAFTTYPRVPWIVPIIASIPFGMGIDFVFTSTFTYLVTAYRPIAASALASNTAMRCTFATVFPLFADQMYKRLGTVGATALLAGLTTVFAPLPFIFKRIGARLRSTSRYAVKD